jgi:hypothetical protein
MMAGANQFTAKQFTDAIPGTGGIIAAIAKRVGCDWHTAKRYIDTLPTVRQAYEDECSGIDDLAESTVIKAIRDGDVGAAKWWLEKRRRDKFSNTQELILTGGDNAIPITLVDYRAGITEA